MDVQKIQGHPLTFWTLTVMTVASFLFAIWSHAVNQPKRELSYWVSGKQIANLDNAGGLSLDVQGEKVFSGAIFVMEVDIWNSGNQEISEEHFLRALQLKTDFKWLDYRLNLYGLDDSQVIGNLTNGLKVKSLFPKSGVKLVFLTREHGRQLIVTGAISGGNNATSGVVHRTLDAGSVVRGSFGYFLIAMWLGLGMMVFRKYKPESLIDRIVMALFPPGLSVVFAWIVFLFVWKTMYGPPF